MQTKTKQLVDQTLPSRPPIVVVMGHVDHGKTTLLDFIRRANVVAKESGGITQHLGAYEIIWQDKKITFLDTPGHEAFSQMRERGAHVADLAILVVAADDGPKPQTKEAYEVIKKADIPFVVALNKVDKSTADPDRVKSELAALGVLVEGWGGSVPVAAISAKEGRGVGELLDTVLLIAELEELTYDVSLPASGVVIEAHLDARRGPAATLLIEQGFLKKGDYVLAGEVFAPVRILESSIGEAISEARPSSPVRVIGFGGVPEVGASFKVYKSKEEIEANIGVVKNMMQTKSAEKADVGILVKADVAGSLEALETKIKGVASKGLVVKFFEGGVGEVTEADIKNVSSAKTALVVGFRVKVKPNVRDLAARFRAEVQTFEVIYEAIDWIEGELKKLVPKDIVRIYLGKLIVLKVFSAVSQGRIIGGRVREGKISRDAEFDVIREDEVIGRGKVLNIERNKIEVSELREGEEGGLLVQFPKMIAERDTLSFFYEREA